MRLNRKSDGITVAGHEGKWYVIDEIFYKGQTVYLLEHEEYGDDAAHIAVNSGGDLLCEEIYDNFPDCLVDEEIKGFEVGGIYQNKDGSASRYKLQGLDENGEAATFLRDDGYKFKAHLPILDRDGRIEWTHSSGGHFTETLTGFENTEKEKAENITPFNQFYRRSLAEAKERGEEELYKLSDEENKACAKYLTENQRGTDVNYENVNHDNGNVVNGNLVEDAFKLFGAERVAAIFANEISSRSGDGRITREYFSQAREFSDFPQFADGKIALPRLGGIHSTRLDCFWRDVYPRLKEIGLLKRVSEIIAENYPEYPNAKYVASRIGTELGESARGVFRETPLSDLGGEKILTEKQRVEIADELTRHLDRADKIKGLSPPDSMLSYADLERGGYYWNGMLPVSAVTAQKLFGKIPIYDLSGETEIAIEKSDSISDDWIYGVTLDDWEACLESQRDRKPKIDPNVNPEILPLYWNKHESAAYLGVNASAFGKNADTSALRTLCSDFGARTCRALSEYGFVDRAATEVRRAAFADAKILPTQKFLVTYVKSDYSGYGMEIASNPVALRWSLDYRLAWKEPVYDQVKDSDTLAETEKACEKFGVHYCESSEALCRLADEKCGVSSVVEDLPDVCDVASESEISVEI